MTFMSDKLEALRARTISVMQSRWAKLSLRVLQCLFTAGIAALLLWQLSAVGWGNIARSLPVAPLFYFIHLALYVHVPLTETFIYRMNWKFPFWKGLPTFFKAKIFN